MGGSPGAEEDTVIEQDRALDALDELEQDLDPGVLGSRLVKQRQCLDYIRAALEMLPARVVEVELGSRDCSMAAPFTTSGEDEGTVCWHTDAPEGMSYCDKDTAPSWCPLRTGPVLLQLKEKEDDPR